MTIHCLGTLHWRPTRDDPFGDLCVDTAQEPPAESSMTLDEYAVEVLRHSVEHANDPLPEVPEGL